MKPTCFLCKKNTARILKAITTPDKDGVIMKYINATKRAIFCSKRCAMNWALIHVEDYLTDSEGDRETCWHFCQEKKKWTPYTSCDCPEVTKENES